MMNDVRCLAGDPLDSESDQCSDLDDILQLGCDIGIGDGAELDSKSRSRSRSRSSGDSGDDMLDQEFGSGS